MDAQEDQDLSDERKVKYRLPEMVEEMETLARRMPDDYDQTQLIGVIATLRWMDKNQDAVKEVAKHLKARGE